MDDALSPQFVRDQPGECEADEGDALAERQPGQCGAGVNDGSNRRPQRERARYGVKRTLNSAACLIALDDGQACERAEADSEGQPACPAGRECLARHDHDATGDRQCEVADEALAHL